MKIGEQVAIQVSRSRNLVYGTLLSVVHGVAQVQVNGVVFVRQLKRVRPIAWAKNENKRRKQRDLKCLVKDFT